MLLRIKNPFCPRVTAYRKLFRPENGLLGNWNFRSELADFWRMPVDGQPHTHPTAAETTALLLQEEFCARGLQRSRSVLAWLLSFLQQGTERVDGNSNSASGESVRERGKRFLSRSTQVRTSVRALPPAF